MKEQINTFLEAWSTVLIQLAVALTVFIAMIYLFTYIFPMDMNNATLKASMKAAMNNNTSINLTSIWM